VRRRSRLGGIAALVALPLLSGCIAAVAIPLVAGGTLYARKHGAFVRAATPVDAVAPYAGSTRAVASLPVAGGETPQVVMTNLTALPPPSPSDLFPGVNPWQPFFDYALAQGAALKEAERPQSALIVPDGLFVAPDRRPCSERFPAVILDLDKARTAFAPGAGEQPAAGLAEGLARLRSAGIVVLWLTGLPAAQVGAVAGALRTSGLDPEGKDQFLLVRGPDDRKQLLREQANEDVCVVAIAGDQRSDFDELFDYLRDPNGAAGLDAMLGEGWFLVPQPLATPAP